MVFEEVQTDLENEGYEVTSFLLPASGVNAPHQRERVWFIAYSNECASRPQQHTKTHNREWELSDDESKRKQIFSKSFNDCKSRVATKSESRRNRGIRNESEEAGPQKSDQSLGSVCGISHTSDSDKCSEEQYRESDKNERARSTIAEQSGRVKSEAVFNNRLHDISGSSSYNTSIGRTQNFRERESRFFNEGSRVNDWQNFPTQSPICDGDDGLSSRLDGITFSKWRNESIKAGGNAIVPQVALQIFKAIEKFQDL